MVLAPQNEQLILRGRQSLFCQKKGDRVSSLNHEIVRWEEVKEGRSRTLATKKRVRERSMLKKGGLQGEEKRKAGRASLGEDIIGSMDAKALPEELDSQVKPEIGKEVKKQRAC